MCSGTGVTIPQSLVAGRLQGDRVRVRVRVQLRLMFRVTAALLAVGSLLFAQQDRRAVALVITGGTVVTMDGAGVLSPGAVAIDGRDIVAVDSADAVAARFQARDTIDAAGDVVLPGLVNTHTHAPMVLYRGL